MNTFGNSLVFRKAIITILLSLFYLTITATAQPAQIPYHIEPYVLNSGMHDGKNEAFLAYRNTVEVDGVPWIRLLFEEADLGANSHLIITSLKDGYWQRLDATSLSQWQNSSAYFNGDAVRIDLHVGGSDRNVFIKMQEIMVGEWAEEPFIDSQCGPVDDRIPSSDPAVGRIMSIGCTGWIITNGLNITAGHCMGGSANVLQFNVPPSLPNGTVQHPGPEDQYSIDPSSMVFTNGGVGNDWGVFAVFDNSVTGLQPVAAQGAAFLVVQDLSPDSIRITGYGVDSSPPERNQTQQTHLGPEAGSSVTTMRYRTDTEGGNSGSPIIEEATGFALGVHTHGGCESVGANRGTSAFHSAFWAAIGVQGFIPNSPDNLSAYSDHTTPTSMLLNWDDPTHLFNGDTLKAEDFTIQIERDAVWIDSVDGGIGTYLDNGLLDGQEYTYQIYAELDSTGMRSEAVTASWIAGGSPMPNPPTEMGISSLQDQVTLYWRNPNTNIDGTPLDDLAGLNVYQGNSILMTLNRSSADSAKSDSVTFISSSGQALNWYLSAFDNENPSNESVYTDTVIIPLNVPILDNFAVRGAPNPVVWKNANADINNRAINMPSEPFALNFNGKPAGGDTIESYPIDLGNVQGSGIVFSYLYQPQGSGNAPEPKDSLRIYFKNNQGKWILVRGYSGTTLQDFEHEIIDIEAEPSGASFLHSQFQIRIKSKGGAAAVPNDDWFMDNIYLGIPAPAIAASHDSIFFDSTLVGDSSIIQIDVQNVGVQPLIVSQVLGTNGIFVSDTSSFVVDTASVQTVSITFLPQTQGNFSSRIQFISNDPVNDTLSVYVEGIGKQITGIAEGLGMPKTYAVSPNYPNPFNPITTIKYQLPQAGEVKLNIFNMLGQKIRTLVNSRLEAGYHKTVWNGRNDLGDQVASGIYIYRFEAGKFLKVRKMILMK